MEFLKSLVPAVISGEAPVDHGGSSPKEPGPRLLRMKRLGLLAMGQTIVEDPVDLDIKEHARTSSSRLANSNQSRLKACWRFHCRVAWACIQTDWTNIFIKFLK
ncbi:hypothetical protein CRENBAI_004049 [Crenichthys baileyi]|uniref:Uncharacterized protein n=1 Tax=Crenichthys baileyi TaxID=28760 RepID=A0AAV9S1W9_9TELE